MVNWIKQYYLELLAFGTIFLGLLICCAPNFTWMNTDCDGIHYTYAAKYLVPSHKTSAPLFLLIEWLFLKLPFGTEFWRMSFMSVIATTIASVFVYLTIMLRLVDKGIKERACGIAGAFVFGTSALVISQSTIAESYALVTLFGLAAYYFVLKGKWNWAAIMLGLGLATHHLIGIPILVLIIAYKELRSWKQIGIMSSFLLFYLYIPITVAVNNPPNMWGNTTLGSFFNDNASTALMLIGGLSIWDFPKRVLDVVGILAVSFGLGLIPLIFGWKVQAGRWLKNTLLWMMILPVIYFAVNLAPQTYVYMMPAIGFGAVLIGIGFAKMKYVLQCVVATGIITLALFNISYFDLGKNLDPELSASKYYYEELQKVPDGGILVAQQGWEWAAVYFFNKENNRNIIPVCVGTLPSASYQQGLREMGVMVNDYPDVKLGERPTTIAIDIMENNYDVWTTLPIEPRTYGATIIPVNKEIISMNIHNLIVSPVSIVDGSTDMDWKWKPSNPYNFITGAIEVEEWVWITFSNYNMLLLFMLGVIGGVPCWIIWTVVVKRKKWSLRKKKEVGMKCL